MKKIALLTCSVLTACSSSQHIDTSNIPETKLMVEKELPQMSRSQVIHAVTECQESGLRPVMIMSRRKINGYLSDVPVDVTCAPRYGK
jgi:uncharacterized protein YcfL